MIDVSSVGRESRRTTSHGTQNAAPLSRSQKQSASECGANSWYRFCGTSLTYGSTCPPRDNHATVIALLTPCYSHVFFQRSVNGEIRRHVDTLVILSAPSLNSRMRWTTAGDNRHTLIVLVVVVVIIVVIVYLQGEHGRSR